MQPIEKELVSHAKTQALLDWKFKNGGTSGGLNKQRFNQVDYKLVTNKSCFFIVFVVSPPSMTMADVPGRYGVNNRLMETFSGSA